MIYMCCIISCFQSLTVILLLSVVNKVRDGAKYCNFIDDG